MKSVPAQLVRFLDRQTPIFIHVAAARADEPPFLCRGYGFLTDFESQRLWVYILKNQWQRMQVLAAAQQVLAVLLTSGVDNESYQVKGRLAEFRTVTKNDASMMEQQRRWVSLHAPNLVPVIDVSAMDCLAIAISIDAVYSQTPGSRAGNPIMEGSE